MWRLNANASSGGASLHVSGDIISPPPLTLRILQFIPQPKEWGILAFYKACLPFLYSMTDWHFPFIFIYLPLPQYVSAGARKQIQKIRNYAAVASHY